MSNVEMSDDKVRRLPPAPKLDVVPAYEPHPLAALMPMMDDEAFTNLKADVAKRGIEHQMTIYQGLLLDGRNRMRAARELGLKLTSANFKEFTGTTAEAGGIRDLREPAPSPVEQQTETRVRAEDDREVSG